MNLLEQIPTVGVDVDLELTTPTGAAIIRGLACRRWGDAGHDYPLLGVMGPGAEIYLTERT